MTAAPPVCLVCGTKLDCSAVFNDGARRNSRLICRGQVQILDLTWNPLRPTPHDPRSIRWLVEIARSLDCFPFRNSSPSIHIDALTSFPTTISASHDGRFLA